MNSQGEREEKEADDNIQNNNPQLWGVVLNNYSDTC